MALDYLFILSSVIILIGCLGIMMMFITTTDYVMTVKLMFIAMAIGLLIACFNLVTFPPHAYMAKGIATFTGFLSFLGFVFNKKNKITIAKFVISFSIIFGISQLILIN